jgi:hypothetical protein
MTAEHKPILKKISELYEELFNHNGYGQMEIEMKFLKKGQKEIIVHCGKDYRYVVDYQKEKF